MTTRKNGLYQDLKRQILTLEVDPDQVLDEATLGEQYGLSRTPVRETLRRLAGEGFLEVRENQGTRVIPMNDRTLRNFFQVAPMIYEAICRLAVQNHKPSQLQDLKRTQERFRRASVNGESLAMVLENNRFHEIMGEMAGSNYLEPSLGRLLIDHARIGHTFFRPHNEETQKRLELSVAHHDEFVEAIGDHDECRAVDLMRSHWELSRADMQRFIAPDGLKAQNTTGDSYL